MLFIPDHNLPTCGITHFPARERSGSLLQDILVDGEPLMVPIKLWDGTTYIELIDDEGSTVAKYPSGSSSRFEFVVGDGTQYIQMLMEDYMTLFYRVRRFSIEVGSITFSGALSGSYNPPVNEGVSGSMSFNASVSALENEGTFPDPDPLKEENDPPYYLVCGKRQGWLSPPKYFAGSTVDSGIYNFPNVETYISPSGVGDVTVEGSTASVDDGSEFVHGASVTLRSANWAPGPEYYRIPDDTYPKARIFIPLDSIAPLISLSAYFAGDIFLGENTVGVRLEILPQVYHGDEEEEELLLNGEATYTGEGFIGTARVTRTQKLKQPPLIISLSAIGSSEVIKIPLVATITKSGADNYPMFWPSREVTVVDEFGNEYQDFVPYLNVTGGELTAEATFSFAISGANLKPTDWYPHDKGDGTPMWNTETGDPV